MYWDRSGGSGAYNGSVSLSFYTAGGSSVSAITNGDGYTTPGTYGLAAGTYYLSVYGVSAGSYAVKVTTLPALTVGSSSSDNTVWETGNLSASYQNDWYTFTADTAKTYNVQWDDSVQGTSAYTGNVSVYAYKADRTSFFSGVNSGYTTPQTITGYAGTVYLRVQPSSSSYGTYAIRVYEQ